jgi:hypothetical protein
MRTSTARMATAVAIGFADTVPEKEIGRVPTLVHIPDAVALTLLAALELLAVLAVLALWRERGRTGTARLIWTAVTLVPVVGLVAFLVWRDPPPPNDPTDRAPPRNDLM